ncbi:hypothetical protein PGT21_033394 [Puccinia graminis f. sp. tritici]|uniref:Amino acid permease/ SLC12A domain-containing protein n=1 Tax=Puccinia graminis f. sp. tritici TaxID=56615 RepID=A0A5B0NEE2_PUCGR|nr:hypothetical protein PGT21_032187 [Puccinia graminis f. sp. tritici]KAA1078320.1 hypothetical protein PGT21_033394 [Puccinia graminis f. sp. tritici]KAA1086338.1 hypothetical protein PGTUg99_014211 [Puccinia graminis f. sp. tritici]
MRSSKEVEDCEEKGRISIQRTYDADCKSVESEGQKKVPRANEGLKRGMESRHIQMISIGGVIGTGLFLGTASALHNAGPAGMVLGYIVMGSVSWVVMGCLGEMVAHLPIAGGHVTLAERFVSPSLSFTMGYNYWYSWSIILPTEMSASAVLINYWITSVNNSVWIFIALAIVISINSCGSKFYGEFEFWLASIKLVSITVLIVLGIVLDLGGGPNREFIGARYWKNPGPWVEHLGRKGPLGHFMGFLAATNQASFSTLGSEIAAFAAAEARNPKKALPTAIKAIIWRLAVFYFLGTMIIGLLVPSNEPRLRLNSHTAASSPFVIAIEKSGIKYLPSIINVVLISSAWSAASSNMYISSRALYSLAIEGNAPKIFRKTNSWGVPWTCTIVASFWGCLALLSVTHSGAGAVFGWLANMYSTSGFLTWIGVLVTYVRWEAGVKAQKIDRSSFPYRFPLRTPGAIYAIVVCSFLVIVNSYQVFLPNNWDPVVFFTGYFPIVIFAAFYGGSYFWYKKAGLKAGVKTVFEMDFVTGSYDEERDRDDSVVEESSLPLKRKILRFF